MATLDVKSAISGTVWQLHAKVGDKLRSGDTIMVLESMKMEIPVITDDDGELLEVLVSEQDSVVEGQVVARIKET